MNTSFIQCYQFLIIYNMTNLHILSYFGQHTARMTTDNLQLELTGQQSDRYSVLQSSTFFKKYIYIVT
jgi:hypothetical protein